MSPLLNHSQRSEVYDEMQDQLEYKQKKEQVFKSLRDTFQSRVIHKATHD